MSMFFMVLGSVLCAAAQTWPMLLFGRAFQGLSAAGCMNMIKIILADKVNLAEQSKNSTIFAIVTGVSYAIGPVIGGYVANSNWRYIFVISIGVAVIGSALIFFFLRKELIRGSHHLIKGDKKSALAGLATIDYGGTILFVIGVTLIILATSWGGSAYSWSSAHVLAPLVVGGIFFASFFVYEYYMEPGRVLSNMFPNQVAMIPFSLFSRLDSLLLALINAATGAALYSAFYFVGIFWTLVQAYNPAKAGTQLLYYTPGLGVGAYIAMAMCNFFPRQTFFPLWFGSIIEAVGFAVLAWATKERKSTIVNIMMAISGAGTGLRMMPGTLHAAGVWPTKKAAVISLMDFSLPFGGTIAITIMSSVFYNKFNSGIASLNAGNGDIGSHNSTSSIDAINSLPLDAQNAIRGKGAEAVMWSFISVLPIMAISVISATLLGNIWISPKKTEEDKEARGEVIYTSYLAAAVTVSSRMSSIQTNTNQLRVLLSNVKYALIGLQKRRQN
jgi:MFS family permease